MSRLLLGVDHVPGVPEVGVIVYVAPTFRTGLGLLVYLEPNFAL